MGSKEQARLEALDQELRELERQFRKAKASRDDLSLELGNLKHVIDALHEEREALAQGQLILREIA